MLRVAKQQHPHSISRNAMKTIYRILSTLVLSTCGCLAASVYESTEAVELSSFDASVEFVLNESLDEIINAQGGDELVIFEMGNTLTGMAAADSFSAIYKPGTGITFSWSTEEGTAFDTSVVEMKDVAANDAGEYTIGLSFGGNPLFQNAMVMITTEEGTTSWAGMYSFSDGKAFKNVATEIDSTYIQSVSLSGATATESKLVPETSTTTLSLLALCTMAVRRRRK